MLLTLKDRRFARSKNLVSYLGLNPSVVESGNFEGGGVECLRFCGQGFQRRKAK
jgi:hypothetical protein